jgi:hypothetical protein
VIEFAKGRIDEVIGVEAIGIGVVAVLYVAESRLSAAAALIPVLIDDSAETIKTRIWIAGIAYGWPTCPT